MNGIIIFGEKGSGKDTVAKFIEEISSKEVLKYNIGDLVRNMAPVFLATDRWNGDERSFYVETALKLKEYDINFLNFYVEGRILKDLGIKNLLEIPKDKLVIVTGGRTEEDYVYFKERGFKIVGVTCDEDIRQGRLRLRDGVVQRGNDNLEKNTKSIIDRADVKIDNSYSEEELIENIREFFGWVGF